MKSLFKIFNNDQLDKTLDIACPITLFGSYDALFRTLKSVNGKNLIKLMETKSKNPLKLVRLFNIVQLILINSNDWFEVIEKHFKYRPSRDQWINTKFLEPYYRFLIKCCTSKESYIESKALSYKNVDTMQMLFYTINMLRQLFKVVQKMPLIGRYYKQKSEVVIVSAINFIAVQAQSLYNAFKHTLESIIVNHKQFIKNSDDERIMRGILVEELGFINEEMKKLFLDKYFYPLGQGVRVKLFRPEEQAPEFQKTFNSIVSNHQETERQRRKEQLEQTLFPGSGLVNWNFYEETLLSGPQLNVSAPAKTFIQLNDMAISQEDQRVEDVPEPQIYQKTEEQSQKETNTSTIQTQSYYKM